MKESKSQLRQQHNQLLEIIRSEQEEWRNIEGYCVRVQASKQQLKAQARMAEEKLAVLTKDKQDALVKVKQTKIAEAKLAALPTAKVGEAVKALLAEAATLKQAAIVKAKQAEEAVEKQATLVEAIHAGIPKLEGFLQPYQDILKYLPKKIKDKNYTLEISANEIVCDFTDYLRSDNFFHILKCRLAITVSYTRHLALLKNLLFKFITDDPSTEFSRCERLMSAPYQRLPRYELLAKDLLKITGTDQGEIVHFSTLLEEIGSLTSEYTNNTYLINSYFSEKNNNNLFNKNYDDVLKIINTRVKEIDDEIKVKISTLAKKIKTQPGYQVTLTSKIKFSISVNKLQHESVVLKELAAANKASMKQVLATKVKGLMTRCIKILEKLNGILQKERKYASTLKSTPSVIPAPKAIKPAASNNRSAGIRALIEMHASFINASKTRLPQNATANSNTESNTKVAEQSVTRKRSSSFTSGVCTNKPFLPRSELIPMVGRERSNTFTSGIPTDSPLTSQQQGKQKKHVAGRLRSFSRSLSSRVGRGFSQVFSKKRKKRRRKSSQSQSSSTLTFSRIPEENQGTSSSNEKLELPTPTK